MIDRGDGRRTLAGVGFFALAIPAGVLLTLGAVGAFREAGSIAAGLGLSAAVIAAAVGVRFEWRAVRHAGDRWSIPAEEALYNTGAILSGTVLTLGVVAETGISAIVAAAVVGVAAALLTPTFAIPVYCGAFVGMTAPELFEGYWRAVLAGGVASVVFAVGQPVFHGVGGKLGTTAFVGAALTVLTTSGTFQTQAIPGATTIAAIVGLAVAGAVVTFSVHTRLSVGPVFASGAVGAIGGVAGPLVFVDAGELVAAGIFAASFVGMTSAERVPNEGWIGLAGGISGIVFVSSAPYLGGSGGKLGTIAFGSCLTVYGLLATFHLVRVRRYFEGRFERDIT